MIHLPQGCRPPDPRQTAYISYRAQKPAKSGTVLHNVIPYTSECIVSATHSLQQCVYMKSQCSPPSYHCEANIYATTHRKGLRVSLVLCLHRIHILG